MTPNFETSETRVIYGIGFSHPGFRLGPTAVLRFVERWIVVLGMVPRGGPEGSSQVI